MADSQNESIDPTQFVTVDPTQFVTVDIYDQTYALRGPGPSLHPATRRACRHQNARPSPPRASPSIRPLRVAVLAALNIADELAALEQRYNTLIGAEKENVRSRASKPHRSARRRAERRPQNRLTPVPAVTCNLRRHPLASNIETVPAKQVVAVNVG